MEGRLSELESREEGVQLLASGCIILLLQAGYTLHELGRVRSLSGVNTVYRNLVGLCSAGLIFYMFGWGFAFGADRFDNGVYGKSELMGTGEFFMKVGSLDENKNLPWTRWVLWLQRWAIASFCVTLVNAGLAERITVAGQIVNALLVAGLIHPLASHWVLSSSGFLSPFHAQGAPFKRIGEGMYDSAGAATLHLVAGSMALGCGLGVGPLRRVAGPPMRRLPYSVVLGLVGSILVWCFWLGLSVANSWAFSVGGTSEKSGAQQRSIVATVVGGAVGGVGGLILRYFYSEECGRATAAWKPAGTEWATTGMLTGLVSVAGTSSLVGPWTASWVAAVGLVFYFVGKRAMQRWISHFDDPLEIVAIHGFCGAWGCIAPGLAAEMGFSEECYGKGAHWGLFYGGGGTQFGVQIAGVAIISLCAGGLGFIVYIMSKMVNLRGLTLNEAHSDYLKGADARLHGRHQPVDSLPFSCLPAASLGFSEEPDEPDREPDPAPPVAPVAPAPPLPAVPLPVQSEPPAQKLEEPPATTETTQTGPPSAEPPYQPPPPPPPPPAPPAPGIEVASPPPIARLDSLRSIVRQPTTQAPTTLGSPQPVQLQFSPPSAAMVSPGTVPEHPAPQAPQAPQINQFMPPSSMFDRNEFERIEKQDGSPNIRPSGVSYLVDLAHNQQEQEQELNKRAESTYSSLMGGVPHSMKRT